MSKSIPWRDVKAKARALDPTWDSDSRVARRRRIRTHLLTAALDPHQPRSTAQPNLPVEGPAPDLT
jgi:hypothetical protein